MSRPYRGLFDAQTSRPPGGCFFRLSKNLFVGAGALDGPF